MTKKPKLNMGIKHLNQYFIKNCSPQSINKISLVDLKEKTIVVDISIYIYKFLVDGQYMEHLYFFLSLFRYHHIHPIFIFDGKPPPEKWDLIRKRNWDKKSAKIEYSQLLEKMDGLEIDDDMEEKILALKKRMVSIKDVDLIETKKLIEMFGYNYYDAIGEADEVCAYFVLHGFAWACLSDDMDMFLYGCPKVIRNLSMMKQEVTIYDTEKIILDLVLSHMDFVKVILLTGSDYYSENTIGIKSVFDYYRNYQKDTDYSGVGASDFYEWLRGKINIPIDDILYKISDMFASIKEKPELHIYQELYMKQDKRRFQFKKIKDLLYPYGFIFI